MRVLLDLTTALAWRGRKAVGIVRTEREIALRLLADPSLTVLPFKFHHAHLRALDTGFAQAMLREAEAAPIALFGPLPKPADDAPRRPPLRRAISAMTGLLRRLALAGLNALPPATREEVRLSLLNLRQAVRNLLYGVAPPPVAPATPNGPQEPDLSLLIHPQPGDVIFTCGLGWDHLDWGPIAALKTHRGVRIVCICYDLIPVLFPEWIHSGRDLYFSHYLNIVDVADYIPCISRTTERDLLAFAAEHGRRPPATGVVILGSDLPASPDSTGIDPALRARLSTGRFALTVGSFEVRKNHRLLLDLWDRLTEDPGFDLDLVIVGLRGWLADDVIARLEASPLFGQRIHWLSNLSDGGLSWLYRECHMVLYPSLYEGWGLPVVEALQQRRPVIASNRGAVPEAGMGIATVIDPDDTDAWAAAVASVARAPRRDTPPIAPSSWDDTAAQIRTMVMAAAEIRTT